MFYSSGKQSAGGIDLLRWFIDILCRIWFYKDYCYTGSDNSGCEPDWDYDYGSERWGILRGSTLRNPICYLLSCYSDELCSSSSLRSPSNINTFLFASSPSPCIYISPSLYKFYSEKRDCWETSLLGLIVRLLS